MNTIDKVLDICRSQIGVTEYPPNSNNVKYNTTYYGQPVYDGLWGCNFPWCVVFLWWCFRAADASEYFFGGGRTANCGTLADYYEERGQLVKYGYKKGDIVFFDFGKEYQHVGIIESVNKDGTYTTIEGNTSDIGSQDNGGAVCRKVRFLMNICAAARWYEEDEDMDVLSLINAIKSASPEERKALGKQLDECVYEYRVKMETPGWAEDELQEAKDAGITDATRPMVYATRLETASMCKRAVKK